MFWWRGPHLGDVSLVTAGLWSWAFHTALLPRPGNSRCAKLPAVKYVGGLSHSLCPHQAFFTERPLQEHPEAHEKIEKPKDLIAGQVNVSQQLQGFVGWGKWSLGPDPYGPLTHLPAATAHTTVFVLDKPTHRHCN